MSEISKGTGEAAHISDDSQVVVFRLSEEEFGLDIHNVREIVRLPGITPIPRAPEYVAGICNLRGNVLPVISTRTRFLMESAEHTDHTRLLVVESAGILSSMVVDSVREVMRISDASLEPPPAVCKGVEREFLSGVLKVDEGKRLILMLDLNEVLAVGAVSSDSEGKTVSPASEAKSAKTAKKKAEEEKQLVSFRVAGDEYAFDIANVREILKITEITSVPNVPSHVRGLFTIRNNLLPIIDLREMLGLPGLISERSDFLDQGFEDDLHWTENLRHMLESGSFPAGIPDPRESSFGKWIESYKTTSIEVDVVVKALKKARAALYASGTKVLELGKSDKNAALACLEEKTLPLLKVVSDTCGRFKKTLEKHICEDQRALVVEAENMTVGFLVDWVDEVIRVPVSVIDETPALASSDRNELKAVAKLDEGRRLIMIMDENALVSSETSDMLRKKMKKQSTGEGEENENMKSLAQQSMDEVQMVTFTIAGEEYGIPIMQVQEINRASDITAVPRAPKFIDGMTNLRGNVIPVINVRSLFGLEDMDVSDRTRIIIVDIGGGKTGLRVDDVNEVLRLSRQDIENTPNIVMTGGVNHFMEGVCKIDGGRRMVMLLNVEKILDEEELKALNAISESPGGKKLSSPVPVPKAAPAKNGVSKKAPEKKAEPRKTVRKKKLEIDE